MNKMIKFLTCLFLGLTLWSSAATIVPGQAIQVNILGVPPKDQGNINATYNVNNKGFIRVWYLNDVKASGLSPDALARKIEAAYKSSQIFTNPTVQVFAGDDQKLQQKMITVGGDVRRPGPLPHARDMTLYQAVTSAGGPTEFARLSEVKLYRNGKLYIYDLKNSNHKLLKIYAGDTIEVPRKGIFR